MQQQDARHRYLISRLVDFFQLQYPTFNATLVEQFLANEENFEVVTTFFRGEGRPHLFFSYGILQKPTDAQSSAATQEDPSPVLMCGVESGFDLASGRVVYVLRKTNDVAVPTRDSDLLNELIFGSLAAPIVQSFENLVRDLFLPALQRSRCWGRASAKQAAVFQGQLSKFTESLGEMISKQPPPVILPIPDKRVLELIPRVDAAGNEPTAQQWLKAMSDSRLVGVLESTVEQWTQISEQVLGESLRKDDSAPLNIPEEQGPVTEIEVWKARHARLDGILAKLRSPHTKAILDLLARAKSPVLSRWHVTESAVVDAAAQAKESLKYLATLDKYMDTLYQGTPAQIVEILPGLVNSVKMMQVIARAYATPEAIATLLIKITNRMIVTAKNTIRGPGRLWEQIDDPKLLSQLLDTLRSCLRLNKVYQEEYYRTREPRADSQGQTGGWVGWNENQAGRGVLTRDGQGGGSFAPQSEAQQMELSIFGKFELFCKRVQKLLDVFTTVQQFQSLAHHRMDGMDAHINRFFVVVDSLRRNTQDLLDYTKPAFDKEFIEFSKQIQELEASLQVFINSSFENITSTDNALALLHKFHCILQRQNLRQDLDGKYLVIFHNYGLDLENVQKTYERCKDNPPVPRNMPPVAGAVAWARQLLRRIEEPMQQFTNNTVILRAQKEARKIIRTYNRVAKAVLEFEALWLAAWAKSVESTWEGLRATLLVRSHGRLYVNFDRDVLQLMQEAKHLTRMGIHVPPVAHLLLMQERRFRTNVAELSDLMRQYEALFARMVPITRPLLQRNIAALERLILPGETSLTWTSLTIPDYLARVRSGLQKLSSVVDAVNAVVHDRIQANLRSISNTLLVNLPADESLSLEQFVQLEERITKAQAATVNVRNVEIERAVEDILTTILYNQEEPQAVDKGVSNGDKVSQLRELLHEEVARLRIRYNRLTFKAVLIATTNSLSLIKRRVGTRVRRGFLQAEQPFFDVAIELQNQQVVLNPSLEEVQRAINRAATAVLRCSKYLQPWRTLVGEAAVSFFDEVARNKEIVKVVLLLTGGIHGLRKQVGDYLLSYRRYEALWLHDKQAAYQQFISKEPSLDDFDAELRKFVTIEQDVHAIPLRYAIGSLNLETSPIKAQLLKEAAAWKSVFAGNLHLKALEATDRIQVEMEVSEKKLTVEISDSLNDLRTVMDTLKQIRSRESTVEFIFGPIQDMYELLARYNVDVPKEEYDRVSDLQYRWRKLKQLANEKSDEIAGSLQHKFKRELIVSVQKFHSDVVLFREDFDANGPMVPGLRPQDAMERLKRYARMFEDRQRKWEALRAGEELFGLPISEYPELAKTQKELNLLEKLYTLYVGVLHKINGYSDLLWVELDFNAITAEVLQFQNQCMMMPKVLKHWDAYLELRKTIEDFLELQPLLDQLTHHSMRDRHWKAIMKLTGTTWRLDTDMWRMANILDANLLAYREDIEEIATGASKELDIETKKNAIASDWDDQELSFSEFKHRGPLMLKGDDTAAVVEKLEESQLALGSMLASRYVSPFRDEVTQWLQKLTSVSEVLTLWVEVQATWMYLEAVFAGGDIMKQLPQEAKRFAQIDKQWTKIMTKANEVRNVVAFCHNNEMLNVLPYLRDQLEHCQKQLSAYLEQKRNHFPRFFFVSDGVLLEILSQSSDPEAIQPHLVSIFDGLSEVVFDKARNVDKQLLSRITQMKSPEGEKLDLRQPVNAVGNVEDWLNKLEAEMRFTMREVIKEAASEIASIAVRSTSDLPQLLQSFVKSYVAQVALLGLQLLWTADCQRALSANKGDSKKAIAECSKRIRMIKDDLTDQTRSPDLSAFQRINIETLITIQVHQQEVWETSLARRDRVITSTSFEWQKQARFYWRGERNTLSVNIADADMEYCYEYLGIKERLVVTPLTDRCYITLSQALMLYLGGAPAGPAGTGKTETVKDLGRTLGKYVVVFNCSDQLDFRAMGKIFKGLCQSGAWGCFDEFNRIELPVLSVVAQQISVSLAAMKQHKSEFLFTDGTTVRLIPTCGYFITMNPGYAGRQELPENLKILFRGVAMMVPDRRAIMKVKLAAAGYKENEMLSKKFYMLYELCEQQLSKQRHYDFGLRNILSVLRTAGAVLRLATARSKGGEQDEEKIFMRTVRDMNLSKLVHADVPLFNSLLSDTFPSAESKRVPNEELESILISNCKNNGLIPHPTWLEKVVQLYDTKLVRHGIMVVGPAGSGKTCIYDTLLRSLSEFERPHRDYRMNPKAITAPQMFGRLDVSNDWHDGIFAYIWRRANRDKTRSIWIVCDGPVDAIWIENLNTVLDDNRLLTLANGDRIQMSPSVKMCFEVENLRNASPATVSRAGIIYVSEEELGWHPVIVSLLQSKSRGDALVTRQRYVPSSMVATLQALFSDHVGPFESYLNRECSPVTRISAQHLVTVAYRGVAHLLDDLSKTPHAADESVITRMFWFALAWAGGGLLENNGRMKLSAFIRSQGCVFPDKDSVFEYFVDLESGEWTHWNSRVQRWKYPGDAKLDFSTLFIPTMDSTRLQYLIRLHWIQAAPVMLLGSTGTAKTVTVEQFLSDIGGKHEFDRFVWQKNNFSSMTTPGIFQTALEDVLEKRMGSTYGPKRSMRMTLFIDDVAMPETNAWGDQPTNEIVRQVIESAGVYSLDRVGEWKSIVDVQYVAAMAHPTGGRNDIPGRLKRHFTILNLPLPSDDVLNQIYGSIYAGRFPASSTSIPGDVIAVAQQLTSMSILLWQRIQAKMLPTPSKFHYIFNLRDMTRITQGVMQSPVDVLMSPLMLVALWKHEASRVLADRLNSGTDKAWYDSASRRVVSEILGDEMAAATEQPAYFVNFLRDPIFDPETGEQLEAAPMIYEPIESLTTLRERVHASSKQFNEASRGMKLDLVLFDMALKHVIRISRILSMPRGSCMLVGVGGSGKQSLTRLASFIQGYRTFQIVPSKSYSLTNFFEDLRNMYMHAGPGNKALTFLFTENEIKMESFLEYINNILSSGEVPGLFSSEDRDGILVEMRVLAKREKQREFQDTEDYLWKFFINKVRDNIHLVLCFSPVGEKFRDRARRFPGLVSGCTLNWFFPWPQEALMDVTSKFLSSFPMQTDDKTKRALMEVMSNVHNRMSSLGEEYFGRFRRYVYSTPKSFLSLLQSYMDVYSTKLNEISSLGSKVTKGLEKLRSAGEDVRVQRVQLNQKEVKLMDAQKELQVLLVEIQESEQSTAEKQAEVRAVRDLLQVEADKVEAGRAEAASDLEAAKPMLEEARAALDAITPKDIKTLKVMQKPPELVKRIFDGVLVLLQYPLVPTAVEMVRGKPWIVDSWKLSSTKLLNDMKFLDYLYEFNGSRKDEVTDETCELLLPYLWMEDFYTARARQACGDIAGLCTWVRNMYNYRQISKWVAPKIALLREAEGKLRIATSRLRAKEDELAIVEGELSKCQARLDQAQRRKQALVDDLTATKNRMDMANSLIDALSSERERWTSQQSSFNEQLRLLPGDALLACSFLAYCGPYNAEFRVHMYSKIFVDELVRRRIGLTDGLSVTRFLVDEQQVTDWGIEGLPTDEHSVQNACILTSSAKYGLLIDPQGQAVAWLKRKWEHSNLSVCQLTDKNFLDVLRDCLQDGHPMIVENVGEAIDPLLTPVLDKAITRVGRTLTITINDKAHEYNEDFRLVLATKLPNPHFAPELHARCTVIDFTVTLRGLESQLLGRVIRKEKSELEEERTTLIEEVNANEKKLKYYEDKLLYQLSNAEGNLIENEELISTLTEAKRASSDIKEKLAVAQDTRKRINAAREEYRAVAVRGSVLYFAVVEMSLVNSMYQTSLSQFLTLFDNAIDRADRHALTARRITAIVETTTLAIYKYMVRGLYEQHKLLFSLLLAAKIEIRDGKLSPAAFQCLLKGGAALDINTARPKPANWLQDKVWLNVIALADAVKLFQSLPDSLQRAEVQSQWRQWWDAEAPEARRVPDVDDKLDAFNRLLLVRAMREDRTMVAAAKYVDETLGPQYSSPPNLDLADVMNEINPYTPVVFLLSQGADPTTSLEGLAKQQKKRLNTISMGQGQEEAAHALVTHAWESGEWVLLQNCHLGIQFLRSLEERVTNMRSLEERRVVGEHVDGEAQGDRKAADSGPHPEARIWITAEPSPDYPIGLLQMSVKLTNEPPAGISNSLSRCFSWVSHDLMESFRRPEWRPLLFAISFLHVVILERRKFGPLGWNKPYDWNHGDWAASVQFVTNHMTAVGDDVKRGNVSFEAIRYMISDIQYGGRITDELDRVTFATIVEKIVSQKIVQSDYKLMGSFSVPPGEELRHFREYAAALPGVDSPDSFGLHANADLQYRSAQSNAVLAAILDVQPRGGQGASVGGLTREDTVVRQADDLLRKLPTPWSAEVQSDAMRRLGAHQPLTIFAGQEMDRLAVVLKLVRSTLTDLKLAVAGTIIMSVNLQQALDAIYDARVPATWLAASWPSSNLGVWFAAVLQRFEQMNFWATHERPAKFWLAGFFNPQGFLTSVKQEVTRAHKAEKWALDTVMIETSVTTRDKGETDRPPPEGVFIYGLYLEGASWDRSKQKLREAAPKELYKELPVVHVTATLTGDAAASGPSRPTMRGVRVGQTQRYRCPVYKNPSRTDDNLIFEADLPCDEDPAHWCMRGVALLCAID